jgi:UDP-N-acetylmuramate dehydrogenase
MTIKRFPLQQYNSFAIECFTEHFQTIKSLKDIERGDAQLQKQSVIIGSGSNILFVEKVTPPIIHMQLKGIKVIEDTDRYKITVGAGENWHALVKFTVDHNIAGLENLALIPGTVGAAPIQNIGAYGVEFSSVCERVQWYDFDTKQIIEFDNATCQFGYRDSIFKQKLKNTGIVTSVTLSLIKSWRPMLNYQGLEHLPAFISSKEIYQRVIQIRQSKLPNPSNLPNAGSFFKNPIIARTKLLQLQEEYPTIVFYPISDESVKVAAGWLIEQAGFKGYRFKNVGVHDKQSLVLVNFSQGSGKELLHLAQLIQQKVYEKFGILLEPEVRLIGKAGDISLKDSYNG